jgi:glycosyltransferase involved in cell wall biosynthesis
MQTDFLVTEQNASIGSPERNILIVAERTPDYGSGSGDQKILYTSYCNLPGVHFCIINDANRSPAPCGDTISYIDGLDNAISLDKKWRYADFFSFFSTKHGRFVRSDRYLARAAEKIYGIIREKKIRLVVFEQTGILMWSWCHFYSDQVRCVLRIHDSHYHYLLADSKIRRKLSSKLALLGSAVVQREYEKKHIQAWDQIQFFSVKEFQYYSQKYPSLAQKFLFTPPSIVVHQNEYLKARNKTVDILFVGNMFWKPNTDAVRWFLEQVLSRIRVEIPGVRVRLVGKNAHQKIQVLDRNVEVIDFVPDLEQEYQLARVFINPTQSGGGIKVKLMHAAAFGFPLVTTSDGISGFKENIQDCLIVRDTPAAFANAVVELLKKEELREAYSRKVFEYARNEFEIHKNQKLWEEAINSLL